MDLAFFGNDAPLLLDGAMGTVLQRRGLEPGGVPELLNLSAPDLISAIHREYLDAGSRVLYANTFGANAHKLRRTGKSVREVIAAGIAAAKRAVSDAGMENRVAVALDIGPLGELLEPLGTLSFEEAYELFREMAESGADAGADLTVIETMTDLYEAKAALLAVKEHTDLPTFVTMSFEETGRTFTGCAAASMARTLEGLGADAIGLNCSTGPDRMSVIIREIAENTRLPVIAKPNAGMPDPISGEYDMGPEAFAAGILSCMDAGASIVGGCCGTDPAYIRQVRDALSGRTIVPRPENQELPSFVCTPVRPCRIDGVRIIGERVNPTGKKRLQRALLENDMDYILSVAAEQEDAGADILDVNVGFPGVDEISTLPRVIKTLQSAVSVPLQLDSSNPDALEAGLRVYNGKASVNSVNGDAESMERILPIVRKYGAAVVGLTLDKNGIPKTARERIEIAERILNAARSYGLPKEDIWIDCLTLTVSAQQEQASETLKAVRYVREVLGLQTVLGVSNISFGLPNRNLISRTFLTQALQSGLTLPIINPNQREMTDAIAAYRVLSREDAQCRNYIARFADAPTQSDAPTPVRNAKSVRNAVETTPLTLQDAIIRGLKSEAAELAKDALKQESELSIVDNRLIPALDRVGEDYERGKAFLPQLLSAAQAAQGVFDVLRASLDERGAAPVKKGPLIVATVQGDIHDIGKNIVKTVLENYGYRVLDLGRDVPPETIVKAVTEQDVKLVGLSALMTTTLPAMEETIRQLKTLARPPVVWVGGAVVTPEYAARMGADYYAKDAKASAEIAKKVFG